jgi:secondary thiamine-phosphate synthase enzyme
MRYCPLFTEKALDAALNTVNDHSSMMKIHSETITVNTTTRVELVDITDRVRSIVSVSGIRKGVLHVFSLHTTMGVYLNENEPNLRKDILELLEKIAPKAAGYHHDTVDANANTFSHLRAILLSNSITIPVDDGSPVLGTWQSVFAAEFDGPRRRRLLIQVIGE